MNGRLHPGPRGKGPCGAEEAAKVAGAAGGARWEAHVATDSDTSLRRLSTLGQSRRHRQRLPFHCSSSSYSRLENIYAKHKNRDCSFLNLTTKKNTCANTHAHKHTHTHIHPGVAGHVSMLHTRRSYEIIMRFWYIHSKLQECNLVSNIVYCLFSRPHLVSVLMICLSEDPEVDLGLCKVEIQNHF